MESRIDDIHRTIDVGFHSFHRVVFAGRYLLERGSVDDVINTVESAPKSRLVPYVAYEIADDRVVVLSGKSAELDELVAHNELLVLIARVYDYFAWLVVF